MTDERDRTVEPLPEVRRLPRSLEPDPEVEDRIVAALRASGHLDSRSEVNRRWLPLAAAVLLFVSGLLIGARWPRDSQTPGTPMFALLLYGEASTADGASELAIVEEYRRWALDLRRVGRRVSGERLIDDARVVAAPGTTGQPRESLQGFFLISASNLEEAESVARSCPHATRGGVIVVRPIAPT